MSAKAAGGYTNAGDERGEALVQHREHQRWLLPGSVQADNVWKQPPDRSVAAGRQGSGLEMPKLLRTLEKQKN